jgi:hypothetical protein
LTLWNWHAVFADQGLLYFWAKYVKKNVSIIIGSEIEHWTTTTGNNTDELMLQRVDKDSPLDPYSCIRTKSSYQNGRRLPPAPYRDFYHFTGNRKPWETLDWQSPHNSTVNKRMQIWRDTLMKVQEKTHYNFTLFGDNNNVDEDGMGSIPKPPMGRFSTYQAMISHIKAKKFFGWHHYEKIV